VGARVFARVRVSDRNKRIREGFQGSVYPGGHALTERLHAQLAVLAFHPRLQGGDVALGILYRPVQIGVKCDCAVALYDSQGRVLENSGDQVRQIDPRAGHAAQDGSHLLQEASIRTRFERDALDLQKANNPIAFVLFAVFAFSNL
jgi:hypothetical protein